MGTTVSTRKAKSDDKPAPVVIASSTEQTDTKSDDKPALAVLSLEQMRYIGAINPSEANLREIGLRRVRIGEMSSI
jgi:hypothetical protein